VSLAPAPVTENRSLPVPVAFGSLSLIWGSSFLFIKIGLDEGLPPLVLVSYRLVIATVFLAVVIRLIGGRLPRTALAARRLALLGLINVAIPFSLITWGEQYTTSAIAAIFNATVPLFAIVLASLVLHDEPITVNRLAGLGIGFAGAVLLASPNLGAGVDPDASRSLIGELAVAAASFSYACGAVFARRLVTGHLVIDDPATGPRAPTPVEIALPQVASAAVVAILLAAAGQVMGNSGALTPPSGPAWFAVSWLGLLGSGVAYLLLFRIIRAWGATRATLVTYLMPVVGITLGVLVLSERLQPAELVGTILIVGGLLLANSRYGQRRLFGRAAAPVAEPPG
jgi:drug/metabolite transporter (DMT)-like permease